MRYVKSELFNCSWAEYQQFSDFHLSTLANIHSLIPAYTNPILHPPLLLNLTTAYPNHASRSSPSDLSPHHPFPARRSLQNLLIHRIQQLTHHIPRVTQQTESRSNHKENGDQGNETGGGEREPPGRLLSLCCCVVGALTGGGRWWTGGKGEELESVMKLKLILSFYHFQNINGVFVPVIVLQRIGDEEESLKYGGQTSSFLQPSLEDNCCTRVGYRLRMIPPAQR
jgi:hypothetical protein